ncbi:hypothetical protein CSUI_007884, partial [Cystoisospora suis]
KHSPATAATLLLLTGHDDSNKTTAAGKPLLSRHSSTPSGRGRTDFFLTETWNVLFLLW